MTPKHHPSTLALLGCVAAWALFGTGCATTETGYHQAERTGDRMAHLRKDIRDIQSAIDETTEALDAIVATAETDPRKPFTRFDKAVDNLETADFKAKRSADEMRDEGKLFFELWQLDIANTRNEDVRKLAESRKTELSKNFQNISRISVMVKDDLNPWISDVRDLHKYLNNDLTPGGISAASDMIQKYTARGEAVKKSLNLLIEELNVVETSITPARAPSSPAFSAAR